MMQWKPVILLIVLASAQLFFVSTLSASEMTGCLKCHAAMKGHKLKRCYSKWDETIHARRAVSCHDCHGGNPHEEKKENAHEGIYSAMNPKSAVYYTKIPGLCGGCHEQELHDFQSTRHYQSLMDKGMGPHCVTCHDSMSTKVLTPEFIEDLCTICHNARNKNLPHVSGLAKDILIRMKRMESKITLIKNLLANQVTQRADIKQTQRILERAEQNFTSYKKEWHKFRFDRMENLLLVIDKQLNDGLAVLQKSTNDSK